MSEFIVHGVPGSPYVRSPLLALEEKGATWSLAALGFGQNRAPEYAAFHPFQKMPVLDHGDYRLYETQAILRYIDRVVDGPSLTPTDARTAARMDQLLGIADCYLAPRVSGALSFPRAVAPRFGMPVDEAAIAAAIPAAKVAIDEVARLLAGQPFLTGDAVTLADLHVYTQMSFVPQYAEGRALLEPHASLRAWLERMDARPSARATSWEEVAALAGGGVPPMPGEAIAA
jgi:glutathione S-transferase